MAAVVVGCNNKSPRPMGHSAADLSSRFDRLVPELLARHNVPGVQIAVIDGGAVAWRGSYGLADRQTSRPVTDSTLFNVGSVSKVVAAWGVMALLRQQKDLALDSPAQRHLKRWHIPPSEIDVSQVTVRRLLSHCSGLSVFPASESFSYPSSLPEMLSKSYGNFGHLRLVREPGRAFEYNNGNYLILQLLVEDVAGEKFASFVRRAVFEPLGMESSTYAPVQPGRIATPHDTDGRALPLYETYHSENFAASGGLFTTAGDLAALVAATMVGPDKAAPGRGVLPPETVRMMTSPAHEAGGRYGLGYKMLPVSDALTLIGHDGSNPGWQAGFMASPEKKVGIVVLANSRNGGAIVAEIVCTWADWEQDIELTGLCEGTKPIPAR